MQMTARILDVLKDFLYRSLGLVDSDFHHGSLAGRIFYGRLDARVS